YAPTTVDIERISARVEELGYRVGSTAAATPAAPAEPWPARMLRQPENVQTAIGALLTVGGAILGVASAPHWLSIGLYAAAIIVAGLPVARKGWATIWVTR